MFAGVQGIDSWMAATVTLKWAGYAFALPAAGTVWFLASQPVSLAADTHGGSRTGAVPWPHVRRTAARLALVASLFAALAALGRIGVQAGALLDDGWRGALDPGMLGLVLDGPLGPASWTRLAGLALVATLPFAVRPDTRAALSVPLAGAALVAVSFALTGHSTREPRLILGALLSLHLVAASFWLGALWPLHRLAGGTGPFAATAEASERFGRQATWIVAVLLLAGTILGSLLVGSPAALLGTSYGRLLLVKIGLVAALLALAAANKWRLAPALSSGDERRAARAARGLRRSIRVEAVAVLALLLATAVLTGATTLPGH